MEDKNIQPSAGEFGKSEVIKPDYDQKIECEVRETFRIAPRDLAAFKNALEEFAAQWD